MIAITITKKASQLDSLGPLPFPGVGEYGLGLYDLRLLFLSFPATSSGSNEVKIRQRIRVIMPSLKVADDFIFLYPV